MSDTGRPTYDGLRQQLHEKDAQLDEALSIIKELSESMAGQGVRGASGGGLPGSTTACG